MSRVVIFGGHGKVALLATPLLVQQGHAVTSIIRNPDHADDVSAAGARPAPAVVTLHEPGPWTETPPWPRSTPPRPPGSSVT